MTADDGSIELGAFSLAVAGFNTAVGQDLTITGNGTTGFNTADPALFVVTAPGTATWGGQLKAGSAFGFLCKRGAGSLAITNGGNTWISRVIRAEEGTLEFGASGALGTVGDWVYVLPGATGRLDNVTYASAPTLYLSGTLGVDGASTWQGPTNLWSSTPTIDVGASSTLTLGGNVSSTASTSLTKSGPGTLILAASNTFSLPVSITAGRVEVAADDRLGNAANAITLAGGTLGVTSGFTMARSVALGAGGGTIDVASGEVLAATGVFSGTSALIKTGGGELALSGANTYTGGTAISEGVLSIASANHLGASGGIALDGGILRSSASIVLAGRAVFLSGSSAVDVTAGTVEFPGVVSGNGKLSKLSAGTLALSGANTNTGLIVVSGGVLSARSATALGTAANPTLVENGATLGAERQLHLHRAAAARGSRGQRQRRSARRVRHPDPVRCDRPGRDGAAGGHRRGGIGTGEHHRRHLGCRRPGSKLGAGTLALNATNTFTGDVIVRDVGVLEIGANDRLGALTNEVLLAGGTLRATANIAATSRTVRVGSSGGTLHANTFTMNLSGIDTTASQPLTLAGPGTIGMLVPPGTSTLAGLLAGDANLNKSGGGTLVISSSVNTFNGATSITNGRLLAIGNLPGPVSVLATGELAGSGPVGDTTVAVGGALSPGGNAPGVITLDSLVMQAGAVLNANLGNASDLVAVTGTATVRGSLVINAGAGFVDGIYQLLNATGGLTYTAGDMTLTSPPVPPPRFSITADGPKLLLTRDGANPTISAITSTSPDGTYNAGDIVNVRVVLSEPANLSGGLTLTLNTTPVATVTFPPSALATDFGTEYDGSYTVVAPEVAADLSVTAIAFIGAGAFTDTVGNTTSGALGLPPQNLGNLKNIAIVNQAPQVDINNAGVGVTTPSPFAAGAPGSIVEFTANSAEPTRLLVLANDPETADPGPADLDPAPRSQPGRAAALRHRLGIVGRAVVVARLDHLHPG